MKEPRYQHSCGLVTNPVTGDKEVVAVSGYGYSRATEIYNVEGDTWRAGPDFPEPARYVRVAQDGRNSFFALGGYLSGAVYLDTIYRFDEDSYEFVLLEQRLPFGAERAFGMMVSPSSVA